MSYRIEDEPRPGALAHLVVHPVWPLFAVMFGGAGLSWPWFVLNGFAVGSPTRRQELAWTIGGFLGSFVILWTIAFLAAGDLIAGVGIEYAMVVLIIWKLAVSYWLYVLQGRSFHLYEHYGGRVRNGLLVVIAGSYLCIKLVGSLPPMWRFLLRW